MKQSFARQRGNEFVTSVSLITITDGKNRISLKIITHASLCDTAEEAGEGGKTEAEGYNV